LGPGSELLKLLAPGGFSARSPEGSGARLGLLGVAVVRKLDFWPVGVLLVLASLIAMW